MNTAACKTDVDSSYDTTIDQLTGPELILSRSEAVGPKNRRQFSFLKSLTRLNIFIKHNQQIAEKLLARRLFTAASLHRFRTALFALPKF